MNLEQLSVLLNDNDEVGKNEPGIGSMQVTVADIKLRKNGIPAIPQDFSQLLKKYNGLSCNGNTIFGLNTNTSFFPDLLDFNIKLLKDEDSSCIILGQDDEFYLVYDEDAAAYRIIDQSDFEERLRTPNLPEAVTWILKL